MEFLLAIGFFCLIVFLIFIATGLLLALRVVLVWLCVIVSPLAFACAILPNLKKTVFDRWRKVFSGLLMVFPVIGVLYGMGEFVNHQGTALFNNNPSPFVSVLTSAAPALAMIAVPFVFMSAMKAAAAALGAAGAFGAASKLARRGINGAKGKAKGHMGNTTLGQHMAQRKQLKEARSQERAAANRQRFGNRGVYNKLQRQQFANQETETNNKVASARRTVADLTAKQQSGKALTGAEQAALMGAQGTLSAEKERQDKMTAYRFGQADLTNEEMNAIAMGNNRANVKNGKYNVAYGSAFRKLEDQGVNLNDGKQLDSIRAEAIKNGSFSNGALGDLVDSYNGSGNGVEETSRTAQAINSAMQGAKADFGISGSEAASAGVRNLDLDDVYYNKLKKGVGDDLNTNSFAAMKEDRQEQMVQQAVQAQARLKTGNARTHFDQKTGKTINDDQQVVDNAKALRDNLIRERGGQGQNLSKIRQAKGGSIFNALSSLK